MDMLLGFEDGKYENFLQIRSEAHGILGYWFLVLNPRKGVIMFVLLKLYAQFTVCSIVVVGYAL